MSRDKSDIAAPSLPVFRGHHLVCLHFYDGTGFDPEYIRHLEDTVGTAAKGNVKICVGADCICARCPHLKNGDCSYYENAEADIRLMDGKALELLSLKPDEAVSWKEVGARVEGIFSTWRRMYCGECDWRTACEKHPEFCRLMSCT
jgi:uncharacterized protein